MSEPSPGVRYVQDLARPYKPSNGLASEQLIQARRAEAVSEAVGDDHNKGKDARGLSGER